MWNYIDLAHERFIAVNSEIYLQIRREKNVFSFSIYLYVSNDKLLQGLNKNLIFSTCTRICDNF